MAKTPATVRGLDLEFAIDDDGLLHIYKQDTELGAILVTTEVPAVPPPVDPAAPRFGESSFNEPFIPEEADDETEESTDA